MGDDSIQTDLNADVRSRQVQIVDLTLFEVTVFTPAQQYPVENGITVNIAASERRLLYWSDGLYLFCLEVPYDMDDAHITELVNGIQPVEDINPYLTEAPW